MPPSPTGMRLYDTQGHHLYLTGLERDAFRGAAEQAPREVRTYCHTLLYTTLGEQTCKIPDRHQGRGETSMQTSPYI